MNASCALQHFCDLHGPQILLCTEGKNYIPDLNDNDNEDLKVFYSQYIRSENPQNKNECRSCILSPDGILVSTIDFAKHMLYISSASTPNQELFKNIRNACVRSLNIEKSAENDHPILFGDDENGYCLSLVFSCKDFHARGSQRLYSLCYLCNDKYHLISLMTLISNCMRQAVYWLQYDANEIYEQEGRIKVNTNLNQTSISTYICRPPPRVPTPRMLGDIVHESNVIYRIHALFVWILRTTNLAIKESLFDALPTEEQTTKQERKDILDNEPILKHRSGTIIERIPSTLTDSHRSNLSSSLDKSNHYENGIINDNTNNDDDDGDDDDDYDSLEYQFSSYGYQALIFFKQFIKRLDNLNYLQYILSNWVIGNQLIIKYTNRTDDQDLIRSFASVLRLFLPDGCCHLMEINDNISSCTANLILFNTDLNQTLYDINGIFDQNSIIINIVLDNIDEYIRIVKLETLPSTKSEIIVPTYVQTLVEILMDHTLNDEAFEAMIIQNKIKYLNKAKLYFQLGRCQIASILSLSERQQMDILHINNPHDLLLIRFWQKGLSQNYKTQIRILKQDDNNHQQKSQKKN